MASHKYPPPADIESLLTTGEGTAVLQGQFTSQEGTRIDECSSTQQYAAAGAVVYFNTEQQHKNQTEHKP